MQNGIHEGWFHWSKSERYNRHFLGIGKVDSLNIKYENKDT